MRLDKGSHIVVPRLYDHDRAYILQAPDGRVVFAIPFQRDFTLIGTTDQSFSGDPAIVVPTEAEIDYLCGVVSAYFRATIVTADVVWAYAGVRALYDDGAGKPQDIGRDYALVLDKGFGVAPLLTVYGGKLTTFRRLAEDALSRLAPYFPPAPPWTANSTVARWRFCLRRHGGRSSSARSSNGRFSARSMRSGLSAPTARASIRCLQTAKRPEDLGVWLGADLTAAEVRYLMAKEGAQTADDVLWRRSKLGLRAGAERVRRPGAIHDGSGAIARGSAVRR